MRFPDVSLDRRGRPFAVLVFESETCAGCARRLTTSCARLPRTVSCGRSVVRGLFRHHGRGSPLAAAGRGRLGWPERAVSSRRNVLTAGRALTARPAGRADRRSGRSHRPGRAGHACRAFCDSSAGFFPRRRPLGSPPGRCAGLLPPAARNADVENAILHLGLDVVRIHALRQHK